MRDLQSSILWLPLKLFPARTLFRIKVNTVQQFKFLADFFKGPFQGVWSQLVDCLNYVQDHLQHSLTSKISSFNSYKICGRFIPRHAWRSFCYHFVGSFLTYWLLKIFRIILSKFSNYKDISRLAWGSFRYQLSGLLFNLLTAWTAFSKP